MKRFISLMGVAAFVVAISVPARSSAQEESVFGNDTVEAKYVGISGGVILGAEVVMMAQAAFGVDKLWTYLVFPVLGAGAGGVGGYYMEKTSVGGSVALLVAGIALAIPAAVMTASAFAYNPEKDGALMGDDGDEASLSFELPPDLEDSENDGRAVTEVEAPPEVGPPGAGVPPSEDDATSPPEEEAPVEDTPSAEGPSTRRIERQRLRKGPRGSGVLSVSVDGRPQLGLPAATVRPAIVSDKDGRVLARGGVEVMVPLLSVYLP